MSHPAAVAEDLETLIVGAWLTALTQAWRIARGRRLGQLRGPSSQSYDARGIHPYSEQWGWVFACELLCPWLTQVREGCDPHVLRKAAQADAEREFAEEIIRNAR
jgi:hypothetical protein